MTDLRQAATLALKALDKLSKLGNGSQDGNSLGNTIAQEAREHLFTALAQPEQGPVAIPDCGEAGHADGACGTSECLPSFRRKTTPPAAQPEQVDCPRCGHVCSQREWVGLTEEEILDLFDKVNVYGSKWIEFARTVEAKLKAKNDH
jgi:transcription elongation factor Elf1